MKGRDRMLIIGGVCAGLSSAVTSLVLFPVVWLLPGMIFAACVIVPWSGTCRHSLKRVSLDAFCCVIGYVVAFLIAIYTEFGGAPLGAAAGAGIMFAPAFADRSALVRRAAWRGLATGTVFGFVFTASVIVPQGLWVLILGIIVWQAAVAVAIASTYSHGRSRCEKAKGGASI